MPNAARSTPAGAPGPWRREVGATVALAVPVALTQLAQLAIGTTDVIMMGWLGPEALAAGALGSHVYILPTLFAVGVLTAVSPLAAQARGAHQPREMRRAVRQGLSVALVLGLPFMVLMWQAEAILLGLGQDAAAAAVAQDYVRAVVWGLVPSLWFMVLRTTVAVLDRPNAALVFMALGIPLNAFTNWVLMFGNLGFPALGVVGAGISSSIVNTAMFAGLLAYVLLARRTRRYGFLDRLWRPDWPLFVETLRVGLPIGVTLVMEIALFTAAVVLMGLIGTNALAANAIASQLAAFTFMIPLGIAQAATIRVGLFVGRRDPAGVVRAGWVALALAEAVMVCTAFVFWFAPMPLIDVFLDLGAAASVPVAALAVQFLAVAAVFQIFDGAQVVGIGALRGIKDTRVPMLIAAVGYWVIGIGAALLFAFQLGFGGVGVWIGLAAGLAVVSVMAVARFHVLTQRMLRPAPVPA